MRRTAVYIVSIWKRMWKTPGYLAIFILIPFLTILVSEMTGKENTLVQAAIYFDVSEEEAITREMRPDSRKLFLKELEERLLNRNGAITFLICDSEEEVKRQTASKQAQCGYILPEDLFERLEKGRYTRSIKSYESPNTDLHTICDEVLFSEIFSVYEQMTFGEQAAEYFLSERTEEGTAEKDKEQIVKRAEELLEKYLYNGSTFQFTYEDYQTNKMEDRDGEAQSANSIPVRGVMALMVYICGLCGTLDALEDETAGRVQRLNKKALFQILTIAVPVFAMGGIALSVIFITDHFNGIGIEIGSMVFFQVLLVAYCCILKKIWKNEERFCGAMPVLILSAAVICPVFVDLSVFLPVLGVLEKLYPLSYYLRM